METEKELEQQTQQNVATVMQLKVTDAATYSQMAEYVLMLRKAVKYFEELYRPRIRQADEVTKALRADMQRLQKPAQEAQAWGDKQLVSWDNEQAKIAEREQLQLQALQKARDEEERLQLAALAEQAGDKELAEEIINTPAPEPTVVVAKDVPKVQGLSYREDWKFEVTDWKLVPARYHRMAQNAKGEWHCHVMQDIGAEVSRLKQTTAILGVRVYSVKVPIGRG